MPVEKLSVSLPPEVVEELRTRRDELSGALRISLERYSEIMRWERAALREQLSDGELSLVLDVLNGIAMLDTHSVSFVTHEVSDGIKLDQLDQKHQCDGPALVRKLDGMSYARKAALVDAAERWWQRVGHGEQPDASEALR